MKTINSNYANPSCSKAVIITVVGTRNVFIEIVSVKQRTARIITIARKNKKNEHLIRNVETISRNNSLAG